MVWGLEVSDFESIRVSILCVHTSRPDRLVTLRVAWSAVPNAAGIDREYTDPNLPFTRMEKEAGSVKPALDNASEMEMTMVSCACDPDSPNAVIVYETGGERYTGVPRIFPVVGLKSNPVFAVRDKPLEPRLIDHPELGPPVFTGLKVVIQGQRRSREHLQPSRCVWCPYRFRPVP
jgi:hypothetical protein